MQNNDTRSITHHRPSRAGGNLNAERSAFSRTKNDLMWFVTRTKARKIPNTCNKMHMRYVCASLGSFCRWQAGRSPGFHGNDLSDPIGTLKPVGGAISKTPRLGSCLHEPRHTPEDQTSKMSFYFGEMQIVNKFNNLCGVFR